MYGLPESFDPSRLVGCTLEQVCFTENTVTLSLNREVVLTIESSFAHSTTGHADDLDGATVPVAESRLMQVVGQSVRFAEALSDGTLRLKMSNGQLVEIYDDSESYESYHLKIGSDEYVV